MNQKELAEKVALLKDGQKVEIDGHVFSAKRILDENQLSPCLFCNVDCICLGDITDVCNELDFMSKTEWYLNLET